MDTGSGLAHVVTAHLASGSMAALYVLAVLLTWYCIDRDLRKTVSSSAPVSFPCASDIYRSLRRPGIPYVLNALVARKGESVNIEKVLETFGLKPLDEEYTSVLEAVERTLRGAADAIAIELRHRLYPPENYDGSVVEGAYQRVNRR